MSEVARVRHVGGPYRVEFTPKAWAQIGRMPWEAFERVQAVLAQLGELDGVIQRPEVGAPDAPFGLTPELSITVDDLVIVYALDHTRMVIQLLQVARPLPEVGD